MNILLDGLPDAVEIAGRQVPINTGYRAGIRFEQIVNDTKKSDVDKLREAFDLYFPSVEFPPRVQEAAVDALLWFYRCGRPSPEEQQEEDGAGETERAFDFRYDADYVYAAFLQAYRIDLTKKNIHWWQFRALFDSLPDDVKLIKVIGYRTAEVPADATPKQRQNIERLKRMHALPIDADQQQLKTDLEKILRNGGNPAALLEGGAANVLRRDPKI